MSFFKLRGLSVLLPLPAVTIALPEDFSAARGSRKRPRDASHLPARRQIQMDALDKENQPPEASTMPQTSSLDALLTLLPQPGASGGHKRALLFFGESARKLFMLEQPDERRVRLVLALKKDPSDVEWWLELLRCPVPGCPSLYNRLRLVRRAITCIEEHKSRDDEGYTEIWLMLAKLHETEVDTRNVFVQMKDKKIGQKHAMLYEEEAVFEFNAGKGGNRDVAEDILERGVDNDALTPAEKENLLEKVVAGTAGWVKAFSGAPIEQKIRAHPRKKQVLQDIRTQDDRKVLSEKKTFKKDISFAQDTFLGLDERKVLNDRKALSDIKALDHVKENQHFSAQDTDRVSDDRKLVTTPRSQFSYSLKSPHSSTTSANTTPLNRTRVGPSTSGFSTISKVPRNETKSPLLTTPLLPTRANAKSQSTSRKPHHPPSRFRMLGGPPRRVKASSESNGMDDSDSDDDDMMAESPKKPSKPLTPVKETSSSPPSIKSETQAKKKIDVGDISRILSWKPKFCDDKTNKNHTENSHNRPAEKLKPTNSIVSNSPAQRLPEASVRAVIYSSTAASVNNKSPGSTVLPSRETESSVHTALSTQPLTNKNNMSRVPDHYPSPKPPHLNAGVSLAKNHVELSPYSPSSASSASSGSSPPLVSTINSSSQDAFASLASRVTVGGLQYIKLEQIGSGGSSKVFRMLGPDLKIYALKKIKLKRLDEQSIAQYTNEINLLRRLQGNPHIIRLVGAEQDLQQRQINVIMEHGEIDLSKRLRNLKGAMDENLLRVIWTQMLQAVDAIHSERIIHGDLKPANFLFVNGALKLIDFGIAKAISNDTTNIERDSQVGTINFMSPEAIQGNTMPDGQRDPEGKMKVGRASDIWSLGCILYQIVYSKPPFADVHSIIEKFRCIIDPTVPIPFPALKNKDLEDVIRSCLQRDHRRRPTITGDCGLLNHPFLRSGGGNSGVSSTVAVTTTNAPQILTQLSDLLRSKGVADSRVNMFVSIGEEGLRNETPRTKRYLYNTQERRTDM